MASNTFVRADIWTVAQTEQGNVVLVRPKESDLVVPIFIGQLETQSILIGLGHVEMPRPLTHDLLLSVLAGLGGELRRIEICDLKESTFFARIVIGRGKQEVELDARPSDAMALAVRNGAEVYIAEHIVEEAGVPVDMIRESSASLGLDGKDGQVEEETAAAGSGDSPDAERERLKAELERAIADEDYERAAVIRDRLKRL